MCALSAIRGLGDPAMNLHTESWKGLLYAHIDGRVECDLCSQMFERAANLAAEKRLSKILLDGRLVPGSLSTNERKELAVKGSAYFEHLRIHPSIAFVGHPPAFNGLGVLAAQERGEVVRLFSSIAEAIEWLGEVSALHH